MRAGTSFLLTLGLLLATGVVADVFVTRHAEEQASELVSSELGAPASVTLDGWPVALRLLAGRVPEVRVVASDVDVGGTPVARLDARLSDVRLRLADLDGEAPVEFRGARAGSLVVELGEEAVGQLAGFPGAVRLGEGVGQVQVGQGTVDVVVSLEAGAVVLRPVGPAPGEVDPVSVDIPALPGNATLDDVRITRGVLRLSGQLTQLRPGEFASFTL